MGGKSDRVSPPGDPLRGRYVFLAVDENPDYRLLAPITMKFYERIGWTPIVMFVVASTGNPYPTSTVAQCSRLFCGALPFADNDWVLTGDIDMIPIDAKYFRGGESANAVSFYSNWAGGRRISMTFKARAKTWRKLMQINPSDQVEKTTHQFLVNNLGASFSYGQAWTLDESALTQVTLKNRDLVNFLIRDEVRPTQAARRIDRVDWNLDQPDGVIDIHCMRKPFSDENWPSLLAAIRIASPDMLDWVREYGEGVRSEQSACLRVP